MTDSASPHAESALARAHLARAALDDAALAPVVLDDAGLAGWLAGRIGDRLLRTRAEVGYADSAALKAAGDRDAHAVAVRELARLRPGDAVLSEEAEGARDAWTADGTRRPARLDAPRVWIVDPLDGTREFSEEGRTDWGVHVALWADGRLVAGAVALPAQGHLLSTDPSSAGPSVASRSPVGGPAAGRSAAGRSAAGPSAAGLPLAGAPGPDGALLRIAVSRSRPPAFVVPLVAELGAELVPMGSAGAKIAAVISGEVDAYVHAGGQYEWDSAAPVAVALARGLHASRIDGSPLRYNQPDPKLPDLLVCRPELAPRLLAAIDRHGVGRAAVYRMSQLDILEAESIFVMREVMAEFERPVLLFSGGKDSIVMLRLAEKAFAPARIPFPVMHVDTGHNFGEVLEFRDTRVAALGLNLVVASVQEAIDTGLVRELPDGTRNRIQTPVLLAAVEKYRFDALFGGARRDEEKARAKERVFSFRDEFGQWDPKNQRPELWSLYNGRHHPGESIRVFPLSNWTELDIWHYIARERVPLPSIYYAHDREVVERDGMFYAVNEFIRLRDGETSSVRSVRYRTVGDASQTAAVLSDADTVDKVIDEVAVTRITERGATRGDDRVSEAAMEDRKREGYF